MTKKAKLKNVCQKVSEQTNEIAEAFSLLVKKRNPNGKWRFTYTVSLSAEEVPEVEQVTEVK